MKHGSLFSGVGGFDLAAEWMGWENVFQVEKDGFCQKVLAKNFPQTKIYGDIKEFDGKQYRGAIDILTGGFPCQPFSIAGDGKGKADSRHLWPEMLRVIKEINPCCIVGENVVGLQSMVLDEILSDLGSAGYSTEVYNIPAEALLAPHKRERLWILAYTKCEGLQRYFTLRKDLCLSNKPTLAIDRNHFVFTGGKEFEGYSQYIREGDGLSRKLDKHRVKALGNAIVPQVAYQIFKAIEQTHFNQ